ncbi:hypothetical protein [Methanobrevibacter olleyae]|uniref:Uncharacterized protein n=1 Tax=Methanobrevibacter olleyae TaxID=294671 RepID=A0A126QYX1_METOL|nr:hypothetical protein [Methanobrevibacter olleyae]AMK15241.1 hypothetical protein YLM1_0684 [Methanobrevibacter olleyae]SFL70880.1 hypothetical protein SAMN02910297_01563 [Methanobrevibacter olleyae]
MTEKRLNLRKLEEEGEEPNPNLSLLMAAYLLGYLKSEKGDKIADGDIENLYIGTCLSMGIGPVEDISELFSLLFDTEEEDDDKALQYYA